MSATLPRFATRILPVVVIDELEHAVPLAQALLDGGIDAIEITLRTPAALAAMAAVARAVPGMCVGAGTVRSPEDLRSAGDAGARFALSPGCTPALLEAAAQGALPFIPGVMTVSEAMAARSHGFELLKLFPAQQVGGPAFLRALAGPLPEVRFCPTGGLTPANVRDYLQLGNVALVGGSWLSPRDALQRRDWKAISSLARQACELAGGQAIS